jgi:signal transduction histidine kinase/ligand-binding sensor domain-containing protein/AraC-like DNA-binding protein
MTSHNQPLRKLLLKTFYGLCISLYLLNASSQPINPDFRHISIDNGLSDTFVQCISQDKKGYMWFGTPHGLNKYDGYEFTTYLHNPANKNTINENSVTSIFEDSQQRLWIGTESSLNYFNRTTGIFENVIKINNGIYKTELGAVKKIAEDKEGRLWLARTHALQVYNPDNKTIRTFLAKEVNNVILGEISDLLIDKKGKLWVATMAGLRFFDRKNHIFSNPLKDFSETPPNSVLFESRILEDRHGNLWCASRGLGLRKHESNKNKWKNYRFSKNGLSGNFINDIIEDENGNIWIATGRSGLDFFDPITEKFTNYSKSNTQQNHIISNALNRLFIDKDEQLWIGTWHNGLEYLKPENLFNHYFMDASKLTLSSNNVMGIADGENGNIWVGLDDGGGLQYLDRKRNIIATIKIPIDQNFSNHGEQSVKSMMKSRSGDIWLGTMNGLFKYSTNLKNWESFRHDPKNENTLNPGFISTILEDREGNIWVGTRSQGLSKYNVINKTWSRLAIKDTSFKDFKGIECLYEDNENIIWVGTIQNGLWSFNPKTDKPTFYKNITDQNKNVKLGVTTIYENAQNQLFIGTNGNGLQIVDRDTQTIMTINESNGLSGSMVFGILESAKGLWISTNKGLSFYDTQKGVLMNYYSQNGLQKGPFLKNSFTKLSTGELSFGGVNGFNVFDPSKIQLESKNATLELTGLLIFNEQTASWSSYNRFNPKEGVSLSYTEPIFKFMFAALNYNDSKTYYYAHRLYPYEKLWQKAGSKRQVNYANLPPGDYEFQVKTSISGHQWGNSFESIAVKIQPKPWLTWWAFALYGVIAFAGVYFLRKFEMARVFSQNTLQLERVIHQKDSEIYAAKINFFANITHELRTPLTMIISPLENMLSFSRKVDKSIYSVMLENAKKLHTLIDQLLDIRKMELNEISLKVAKGDIISFTKQILTSFENLAQIKKISLTLISDVATIELWYDWDKMEKILNNLITNAIKFTPVTGKISVKIKKNDGQNHIEIAVEDNGCGVSKNNINRVFDRFYHSEINQKDKGYGIGLAFTKELVELHHGKIELISIKNFGSTFSCYFPIGNAHLKPNEIIDFSSNYEVKTSLPETHNKQRSKDNITQKGQPSILIVEDSTDFRQYLASQLGESYNIIEANNGLEALELLKMQTVDLIISDVMMPEMDGILFCEHIKTNLNTSHIPVILLSALSSVKNRLNGIESGADGYIAKPFNMELLKAEVANLIRSREALRLNFSSFENFQIKSFSPSIKDETFITEVIKIIDEHLDDSAFEKEDLLQEMRMSHSSMYRKLKSLTNLSLNEFIRKIRLQRSLDMLSDPDLNVSEVAYSVGFSDPKYFSICFKKTFAISPTEFKEKVAKRTSQKPNFKLQKGRIHLN